MSVRLFCPHCGSSISVDSDRIGQSVACTSCGESFIAPAPRKATARAGESAAAPPTSGVTQSDVEAARARVAELSAENVGLQVELSRRRRHRQRLGAMLAAVQRMHAVRQWLDHTLGRVGGFFITVAVGSATLVVLVSLFSVGPVGHLLALLAGVTLSAAFYLAVAYYPDDDTLAASIGPLAARFYAAASSYDEQATREAGHRQTVLAAEAEMHRLSAAHQNHLHWLRSCLWEQMTATHFANYLAEVLTHHGHQVQRIGREGEQSLDLIATRDGRHVGIVSKGCAGLVVGDETVKQAQAAMAAFGCQGCAVITNATFTPSARVLAKSSGCVLVEASQMREFIEGHRAL